MYLRFTNIAASFVLATLVLEAHSPVSIVERIEAGHVNTVRHPAALAATLAPPPVIPEAVAEAVNDSVSVSAPAVHQTRSKGVGYRVQVFSDNNPRTAKNEARTKQRAISSRCPEMRTYVTYTSPYWRLKVGDFRTQHEAEEAAGELRRLFPAYSKEIRVVRDRINLSN